MRNHSRFGQAQLVIGIILVILGIFTFFRPQTLLRWVVIIYGIIAVITGISDIVFYVKTTRYTGFAPIISLITGLISTMAGFMLIIYPGAGTWVLILILPIWIIAHSISRLCHLDEIRTVSGSFNYYFTMILNILGIIFGIIMIFSPTINFLAVGIVLGTCLLVMGFDMISDAIRNIKAKY